MSKNRKLGIAIWFIVFALSMFLLLVIPKQYTPCVIATLIFNAVAFISVLILWTMLFKQKGKEFFYSSSALTVSFGYLVFQFVLSLAVSLLANLAPTKTVLIVNAVAMAMAWIMILSALCSKNYAQHVNSRQKDHHTEL